MPVSRKRKKAPRAAASSDAPAQASPATAPAVSTLFRQAVAAHQENRLEEAAAGYLRVLDAFPNHPDSLVNLGNALRRLGRTEEAVETYRRAITGSPETPELWFNFANALTAQGALEEAEAAYRQALALRPDLAAAQFNLGNALRDLGKLEEAVEIYRQAAVQLDRLPRLHGNLGNVLKSLDRLEEAEASHRRAVALDPSYAEGYYNLGNTLTAGERYDEAEAAYRRTIALKPDFAEAHLNLANALFAAERPEDGMQALDQAAALRPDLPAVPIAYARQYLAEERWSDAEAAARRAAVLAPADAQAHFLLGRALHAAGHHQEAAESYRTAHRLDPDFTQARVSLGMVLHALGAYEEAIEVYEALRDLDREDPDIHSNLGVLYHQLARIDAAEASLREAVRLKPDFSTALSNLAYTLIVKSRLTEAVDCCERALAVRPDYTEALSNLGYALGNQGRLEESAAAFRRAFEIDPTYYKAQSNLLFVLNYDQRDPAAVAAEHRSWGDSAEAAVPLPKAWPNARTPEKRLRVGYVSPDFRRHSVAYFFEPLLAAHDRATVEAVCYAHVTAPDAVTERLKASADEWHDIAALDDDALAEKIAGDSIDILVDLAGHTAKNRLPAFAHKPAPIQMTYLGYPNTTGLSRIDYRLTDAVADPPGQGDTLYAEALVRLPRCFLAYKPSPQAPEPGELPADRVNRITFGSFNNNTKITRETIAVWARILKGVPNSRMLLKAGPFADEPTAERYRRMFVEEGVDPKRVRLFGYLAEVSDHLTFYANIDLALDSFPYNGTTTTCEALWMGVPVLTFAGDVHASRVGASLLKTVGADDLVTDSADAYVERALALANDPERLRRYRTELRPAMAASPLTDGASLARAIEGTYRDAWRRWCEDQPT